MKINDTPEIESKEITLTKEMLDIDHLELAELIKIPLNLKIDDLGEGNCDFVTRTNEIAEDGEEISWVSDADYDKSYVSIMIDPISLIFGMDEIDSRDAILAEITVIPFFRTIKEIKAEVAFAKECDEIVNQEEVRKWGVEPLYYSDEVEERVLDEQHWFETHDDRTGHNAFYNVKTTPEELEEVRQLVLSVPPIRRYVEKVKNAISVQHCLLAD